MDEVYETHGVRFQFPDDWELREEEKDREFTVTVSSPETSFWSLVLLFDRPQPEHVMESALEVFRQEYDELDIYPSNAPLCNCQTVARDIEFVCLELINSAFLRAFQTERFTALVLYQATDIELQNTNTVLNRISQSLTCYLDDPWTMA